MPNGIHDPALTPLHPPKPPPEVKERAVWKKTATSKTDAGRELVRIVRLVYRFDGPPWKAVLQALNFKGQHFDAAGRRTITITSLRKYWEPA